MLKKILTIAFLFILGASQAQENKRMDSLLDLTSKYSGTKLVDVFIELAKMQGESDKTQALQTADEAIRLAQQIKYTRGAGLAFIAKGNICIANNSPQSGIAFFEEAKKIFKNIDSKSDYGKACLGVGESFAKQGLFDEATKSYQEAIGYFDYIGDYKLLASTYYKTGTNYNMQGDYPKAFVNFSKSHEFSELIKDSIGIGIAINSMGIVKYNTGDYKDAFQAWSEYEKIMNKLRLWHNMSSAVYNKGIVYMYWAAYDDALASFDEALALELKSGNNSNIAGIYNSMGNVFQNSGKSEKAFEYYRKSVSFSEKTDSKSNIAVGLHNIGDLHLHLGNADSALYYVQKSYQIENTLFNKVGIAETKATLGNIYIALKKYPVAFSYFDQAELVFIEVGFKNGLADVYKKYGHAYADIGNDSLAIKYIRRSNEVAKEIGLNQVQIENLQFLSTLFERNKQYKEALQYQKDFQRINDSVFNQLSLDKTAYLSIKLEKEAQESKYAQLQHAQEVANYENKFKDYITYFISIFLIVVALFFYSRYRTNKRTNTHLNNQYQIVLESEEKIKALLNSSHDTVLLIDNEGVILAANSKAETILKQGEQLIGLNFFSIAESLFGNQLAYPISIVSKLKKSRNFAISSKTDRNYEVNISPIFKQGIEVSGLAIFIQDVTDILASRVEKMELEKQIFQMQKLESIGTMAGGVAHDFNNYLGTILGYSSMGFEDSQDDSNSKRYFHQIMAASKAAQHTVKKILTFSRNDQERKLNRVNLVEVAKESLEMLDSMRPLNTRLQLNFAPESIEILGNEVELQQVFINLFTNAFHAMEFEEKAFLECTIGNSLFEEKHKTNIQNLKSNNIAGICVKDNGMGMNEKVLNRIFEPFFTTKDVGKGTGLGLSIVHGIINNHKGVLVVESTVGKGTEFYIYLPLI
jgi:PAS domain S-box-containing protein